MSLLENIRTDMLNATKAGNVDESQILKMVIATVKNEEITKGESLSDDEVLKVLRKESKKIQDSIDQFTKMGRVDLLEKEEIQLNVLQKYLPQLMDDSKVRDIVKQAIADSNASGMKDMGKVMGIVMREVNGQADGNTVKNIVGELLS
jgi:uncharacterized protein YqeY